MKTKEPKKEEELDNFGDELPFDIVVDGDYSFKRLKNYKYIIKGTFYLDGNKKQHVLLISKK